MAYTKKLNEAKIQQIIDKGVKNMPSNPASRGYSLQEIREFYYTPEEATLNVLNEIEDSVKTELDNLASEKVDENKVATINGQSIINGGNVEINTLTEEEKAKLNTIKTDGNGDKYLSDDGKYKEVSSVTVDSELSVESENPVQNKVITEEFNKKQRTLDTAPTTTTVGYVGEIVQVSNGTIYQCTAISGDTYTWKKIIKENNFASSSNTGVVKLQSSGRFGIDVNHDDGRIFIYPAQKSDIETRYDKYDNLGANYTCRPITAGNLRYAVMKALSTPVVDMWNDEDKALARATLGATALYKHTITFNVVGSNATVYITYYSFNTNTTLGIAEPPYIFIDEEDVISPPIVTIGGVLNPKKMELRGNINNNQLQYALTIDDIFNGENVTVDGASISHSYVAV